MNIRPQQALSLCRAGTAATLAAMVVVGGLTGCDQSAVSTKQSNRDKLLEERIGAQIAAASAAQRDRTLHAVRE